MSRPDLHVFDMDKFYTVPGNGATSHLYRYYKLDCDDRVAIHVVWWNKGLRYAATYDHRQHMNMDVMDWCSENMSINDSYLIGADGSILFNDPLIATQFKLVFG